MSIMILHDKANNNWTSLGLGPLSDAMNPKVTRERNGIYDLIFEYPVKGQLFKEIQIGRWVVADAGIMFDAKKQRFEIAKITKPMNGRVTVYCEHYRYQLLRSVVKIGPKYENINAQGALNNLKLQMDPQGDFTFYSDVATQSSIDFTDPSKFDSAQDALGGTQGSILDNFGGEYLFNNNEVRLLARAGMERNVIIAYGKNLTDISQEESIENTYTSIYGYANLEDSSVLVLPEGYIDSDYVSNYTQRRIKKVDFSNDKPENVTQLRSMVTDYIKNNKVGIPSVSIKASYADLSSAVGGDQLRVLETLDLCDWVTILFNELDINTTAQIIKTVWNVALDKFDTLELGDARTNLSKVIDDKVPDTDDIYDRIDWLEDAKNEASDILNNPGEGHVVIYPSLADPQEILIMDTTEVNTARNIWKWNAGGLGFSSTGYMGTYGLAMTNNGAIVADRVTTGTLRAINIEGVSITGSTIETSNASSRLRIHDGTIDMYSGSSLSGSINSEGQNFWYGTRKIGYIGEGQKTGNANVRGVAMNLEATGDFIVWGRKASTSSTSYDSLLSLDPNGTFYGDGKYGLRSAVDVNIASSHGLKTDYIATASYATETKVYMRSTSIGGTSFPCLGDQTGQYGLAVNSGKLYFINANVAYPALDSLKVGSALSGLGSLSIPISIRSDGTVGSWYNITL